MKHWFFLFFAIVGEIVGTSALSASQGFSKPLPIFVVVLGYGLAFFFLSQVLNIIPIGITYAIWSGVGITGITLIGWLVFDQKLDLPALLGIGLIVAGVAIMNIFSTSVRI